MQADVVVLLLTRGCFYMILESIDHYHDTAISNQESEFKGLPVSKPVQEECKMVCAAVRTRVGFRCGW